MCYNKRYRSAHWDRRRLACRLDEIRTANLPCGRFASRRGRLRSQWADRLFDVAMSEEQFEQTTPEPDDLNAASTALRDDPLRELLAPLLEEFLDTILQGSALLETLDQSVLPPDKVLPALKLSVRQISCLAAILKELNAVGAATEQRETALVFALLPLIAGQIRANQYRTDEENAFLTAFAQSRTEDDQLIRRWYDWIIAFFHAVAYTERFPGAHEYLLRTEAAEEVQDLLWEIGLLEAQLSETEEQEARETLDAGITAHKEKIAGMLQSAHVRPEQVKVLIDAVEVQFSMRKPPLAAYTELVYGLHALFETADTLHGETPAELGPFRTASRS